MKVGLAEDLTGKQFGGWTVLKRCPRPENKKYGTFWWCSCECGNAAQPISSVRLKAGLYQSCGCREEEARRGLRFGKWTVLSTEKDEKGKRKAHCICDCGTTRTVDLASLNIRQSGSCGCSRGYEDQTHAPITKIMDTYKRQASDAGREWGLDRDSASRLLTSCCYYCGVPPSNTLRNSKKYIFKYNGIDRLDNSLGYVLGNVVSACRICNLAKHAASEKDFLATIKRIYEFKQLQNLEAAPYPEFTKKDLFVSDSRPRWSRNQRKEGQRKRQELKNNLSQFA